MPTDEQKRRDFIEYLKQIKQKWTIAGEAERLIITVILKHKGDELDVYIGYFKALIRKIEILKTSSLDIRLKEHPKDGRFVEVFIAPAETTKNYISNRSLHLYFVEAATTIYDFEVWH